MVVSNVAKLALDGLSVKQAQFIKAYLSNGGNGAAAVRVAYPDYKPENARIKASQLYSKSNIRKAIIMALEEEKLNPKWAIQQAKLGAIDEDARGMERFKNLELICKIAGYDKVFDDPGGVTINVSGEQIAVIARDAQAFVQDRRKELELENR